MQVLSTVFKLNLCKSILLYSPSPFFWSLCHSMKVQCILFKSMPFYASPCHSIEVYVILFKSMPFSLSRCHSIQVHVILLKSMPFYLSRCHSIQVCSILLLLVYRCQGSEPCVQLLSIQKSISWVNRCWWIRDADGMSRPVADAVAAVLASICHQTRPAIYPSITWVIVASSRSWGRGSCRMRLTLEVEPLKRGAFEVFEVCGVNWIRLFWGGTIQIVPRSKFITASRMSVYLSVYIYICNYIYIYSQSDSIRQSVYIFILNQSIHQSINKRLPFHPFVLSIYLIPIANRSLTDKQTYR